MLKRTKIVCTLGPSSESVGIIQKMVEAGMNVARLNFSHGTYEHHAMLLTRVRNAAKKTGEPVAVMQDLQGPKIRVGVLPPEGVELLEGKSVSFDTSITGYSDDALPVDYPDLHAYVKKGERLLLADGKIETKITEVRGTRIEAIVVAGGGTFS